MKLFQVAAFAVILGAWITFGLMLTIIFSGVGRVSLLLILGGWLFVTGIFAMVAIFVVAMGRELGGFAARTIQPTASKTWGRDPRAPHHRELERRIKRGYPAEKS